MPDFLRRTDVQAIVLVGAITLVVALTYWGFRPPYANYLPMLHLARNPEAFPLDSILANSVYLKASFDQSRLLSRAIVGHSNHIDPLRSAQI